MPWPEDQTEWNRAHKSYREVLLQAVRDAADCEDAPGQLLVEPPRTVFYTLVMLSTRNLYIADDEWNGPLESLASLCSRCQEVVPGATEEPFRVRATMAEQAVLMHAGQNMEAWTAWDARDPTTLRAIVVQSTWTCESRGDRIQQSVPVAANSHLLPHPQSGLPSPPAATSTVTQITRAANTALHQLGGGYREHVYQRALAHILRQEDNCTVITEVDVAFRLDDGTVVGTGRADLVFQDTVVEVKVGKLQCRKQAVRQALHYQKALNLSGPTVVVVFSDVENKCQVFVV